MNLGNHLHILLSDKPPTAERSWQTKRTVSTKTIVPILHTKRKQWPAIDLQTQNKYQDIILLTLKNSQKVGGCSVNRIPEYFLVFAFSHCEQAQ